MVWNCVKFSSNSVGFIWTVHSHTELLAAVSHTEIVTGYFIRQKTKRALDEVDIYLTKAVTAIN